MKKGYNACAGYKDIKVKKCCGDDGIWQVDDYPRRAKTICDGFIDLYSRNGKVRDSVECVARCLVRKELENQKQPKCRKRNAQRLYFHFSCYAECGFFPDLANAENNFGLPEGGWQLGIKELIPDAVSDIASEVIQNMYSIPFLRRLP